MCGELLLAYPKPLCSAAVYMGTVFCPMPGSTVLQWMVMSSYLHLRLKEKHIYLYFGLHKIMLGVAPCRKMPFLPYCFRAFCIIHPSCKQYSQKFSRWISAGWVDLGKTF